MCIEEMKLCDLYRFKGLLYFADYGELEFIKFDGISPEDKLNTVFKNMFRIFTTKEEALEEIKNQMLED